MGTVAEFAHLINTLRAAGIRTDWGPNDLIQYRDNLIALNPNLNPDDIRAGMYDPYFDEEGGIVFVGITTPAIAAEDGGKKGKK